MYILAVSLRLLQFCTMSLILKGHCWYFYGIFATDTLLNFRDSEMPALLHEVHISECGTKSLKRFQVIDLTDKLTFTVLNK